MMDGFPVYGECNDATGNPLTSCWRQTEGTTGDNIREQISVKGVAVPVFTGKTGTLLGIADIHHCQIRIGRTGSTVTYM